MGFEQINTADFDYQMMLATINAAYIGKAEITLSNYDNDLEPVIKVGAKIEVNGALIKLTTDDATPTGYTGITNSTTFYLYYDESAGVAIYSETVPVWNDALQGHYNGNDRAFFSMYKDSGGTLYENKSKLSLTNINNINSIVTGSGLWTTQGAIYDVLAPYLKNVGDKIMISGTYYVSSPFIVSFAERKDASTITLNVFVANGDNAGGVDITSASGFNTRVSMVWGVENHGI